MKNFFFFSISISPVKVKVKSLSCVQLCDPMGCSLTSLLRQWDFPGKSTGVGCHFFLQGIFPTQGLKLDLLHCRQMFYHLSHQGSHMPCRAWDILIYLKHYSLFIWNSNLIRLPVFYLASFLGTLSSQGAGILDDGSDVEGIVMLLYQMEDGFPGPLLSHLLPFTWGFKMSQEVLLPCRCPGSKGRTEQHL